MPDILVDKLTLQIEDKTFIVSAIWWEEIQLFTLSITSIWHKELGTIPYTFNEKDGEPIMEEAKTIEEGLKFLVERVLDSE